MLVECFMIVQTRGFFDSRGGIKYTNKNSDIKINIHGDQWNNMLFVHVCWEK